MTSIAPVLMAPPRAQSRAASQARSESHIAWLLVSPFLIGLFVFLIVPCIGVITLALTDWQLGQSSVNFTGLQNFVDLINDSVFHRSASNTLIYAALVT